MFKYVDMDNAITRNSFGMKTMICFVVPLLGMMSGTGCDDVFEKDISGEKVQMVAPGDSVVTTREEQIFLWEELEGATAYRLTVVSPCFGSPAWLVMDTLCEGTAFPLVLVPATYQWRVKPENSAYVGDEVIRTLIIESEDEDGEGMATK